MNSENAQSRQEGRSERTDSRMNSENAQSRQEGRSERTDSRLGEDFEQSIDFRLLPEEHPQRGPLRGLGEDCGRGALERAG